MITIDNLKEVINSLDVKDLNRIKNSTKEYVVLYLHTFNVGSYATVKLTNNCHLYRNVSHNGNVILDLSEVLNLIN